MQVTLVDNMGTDLSVVNAARVSFAKMSWWANEEEWLEFDEELKLKDQDKKLIKYLAKHNHWTPFAHNSITLHIKAPIFVARQLGKHQVGFVWNEVSRRYVTDEPEFYYPTWRMKPEGSVKQGSGPEFGLGEQEYYASYMDRVVESTLRAYEDMVRDGVCPEQARMVLPQNTYTEWYWTGNLYGFYNVWKLRTDPHTQKETQEVAKQIGEIMSELFPESWKALTDG